MLFRGPHETNDVGAIGSRTNSEHSGGEDETCSTSERSYTSAESATAQSFELRMAQLEGNDGLGGTNSGSERSGNNNINERKLLSPGYQLFPTNGELSGAKNRGNGPHSLTLVGGVSEGERRSGEALSGTRANDYPDEDERDDDYLTALLSDIERHAARLDTQFFQYPSAESLKQQMASTQEAHAKNSPTAAAAAAVGGGGSEAKAEDTAAGDEAAKADASEDGTHRAETAATPTAPGAAATHNSGGGSGSSHSTGTKLFLGGLRYEVIQSGRHTVSWIFQVACGVHINPSSILIHRKTKNGRSNVAPTGCASVFVADDKDVATLLEMNQRIYCAEEGVYVSPSPDVMKELIASKDIVDVTGGRVRGPTHPVVIERAYSVSHHHGHHSGSGATAANGTAAPGRGSQGGTNAAGGNTSSSAGNNNNAAAAATTTSTTTTNTSGGGGGGSGHRRARTPSVASAESNLSNQLMGGLPPPYGGVLPPQYSNSNASSVVGAYQPPSYTSSSVSSSSLGTSVIGVPIMGASPTGFVPGAVMMSGQSTPSIPQNLDDGRSSSAIGPPKLDPQRVTFHPYLRGSKAGEQSPTPKSADGDVGASTAHTILFLAALPSDATEEYVSWLFSLMSITLPASRIHIISGSATPASTADCCATVSVAEGDVSIALNFHHRVLCTSRGVWVGYSAQDIAALRASDSALRDAAVLHVDRRMFSQPLAGGGSGNAGNNSGVGAGADGPSAMSAVLPSAYLGSLPMGGGAGRSGGGPSMPPPPASYPHVFGAMPLPGGMPTGPGGVLPMAGPWGFTTASPPGRPGVSGESLYSSMPPPPAGMMGGTAPGLPPGAMPIQPMMAAGSGYSMPPPPPPFSFTQSVTIGDRTYQLPPGATVQYLPVITASQGMTGAAGEMSVGKNATPSAAAVAAKNASSRASTVGNESTESAAAPHGSPPPHAGQHS
jgi:hypothetical protein